MNQYASSNRFLRARNLYEDTLDLKPAKADLVIAAADWVEQIATPVVTTEFGKFNPNGNIVIKSAGVYSNMADGLIFKLPEQRLMLNIIPGIFTKPVAPTDTLTMTAGLKAATDNGALIAGDIILVNNVAYRIATAGPMGAITFTDYARGGDGITNLSYYKLTGVGGVYNGIFALDISQLNTQFNLDYAVDFSYLSPTVAPTVMLIQVTVNREVVNPNFIDESDLTFMTTTITDALDGAPVYFDAGIEIEFTPA